MTCKVSSPLDVYFRHNRIAKLCPSHMIYITPIFFRIHFRVNGLSDSANFFICDVKWNVDYGRIFYFDLHGYFLGTTFLLLGRGVLWPFGPLQGIDRGHRKQSLSNCRHKSCLGWSKVSLYQVPSLSQIERKGISLYKASHVLLLFFKYDFIHEKKKEWKTVRWSFFQMNYFKKCMKFCREL